jgi:hypothetical protein
MFSGRIMAINGNYNELIDGAKTRNEMMERLLDKEVASLFVPADKAQNSIFKIEKMKINLKNINVQLKNSKNRRFGYDLRI